MNSAVLNMSVACDASGIWKLCELRYRNRGVMTYEHAPCEVSCERTESVWCEGGIVEGTSAIHESMQAVVVLEAE